MSVKLAITVSAGSCCVAWLAPSHYLNQYWLMGNWTLRHQLQQRFLQINKQKNSRKCFGKCVKNKEINHFVHSGVHWCCPSSIDNSPKCYKQYKHHISRIWRMSTSCTICTPSPDSHLPLITTRQGAVDLEATTIRASISSWFRHNDSDRTPATEPGIVQYTSNPRYTKNFSNISLTIFN